MIDEAFLSAPDAALLEKRVGGVSVLERQLFTASRAGLKLVRVEIPRPDAPLRLPPGLDVLWSSRQEGAPLSLSGRHFLRVETLRAVLQTEASAPMTWVDAGGRPVAQVPGLARGCAEKALPEGSCVYLESEFDKSPILRWLLRLGTKSQDGFMARHFDRHLSLSISRFLLDTPVSPNMMTVLSSLIGLCGAAFFLAPEHSTRLAGAVLIWLHSVLDGCDGELARIRFQESPLGRTIDFWGDNLVHLALFGCMAVGFAKADRSLLPVFLGLAAGTGTIGSAIVIFRKKTAPAPAQAPAKDIEATLTKVENILAARDFIYLLVFLAYVDRTYEFLWAAAVGSLLFFGMLLYLGRMKNEEALKACRPREGEAGNLIAGNGGRHQHLYSRS